MSLFEHKKEKEEIYKILIENTNVGIFISTLDGRFLYANPAAAEMSGYDNPDDFMSVTASKLYAIKSDREKIMRELMEKGFVKNLEIEAVKKDGTLQWISLCAVLWEDLIIGTVTDVTEFRILYEKLKENQEKYKIFIDNINTGIYISTPEGKFLQANPAVAEMAGYDSIEEFMSIPAKKLYAYSKDREKVIKKLLEKGSVEHVEIESVKKDGTLYWISLSAVLLKDRERNMLILGTVSDISDRKNVEEALRQSEERYRELFERINTCVAVYEAVDEGADFIIKEFNSAAERAEKISRKDITGKKVTEVFPGVLEFGILDVFRQVWQSGLSRYHPVSFYRDNRIAGWRDNFVYRLPSGEVVAVYEDVTEKKQAEEALKESEERFRALFEQVAVGVAQIETKTGRFVRVNQKYCHIAGLEQNELLSETFMNITHPDDIEADLENMKRLIAGDIESFSMEKRYVHSDDTVVWVNLTVSPMWKKGQAPDYHIAVVEDITERKHSENALKESEQKYRLLHETMMDAFVKVDMAGNIIETNRSYQNMLGYSSEELFHMAYSEITPVKWHEFESRILKEQILPYGHSQVYEKEYIRKDGSIFPVELRTFLISDEYGRPSAMWAIVRDMAERKKIEEKLFEAQKMDSIGNLAGGVAHDFNNMLGGMLGYATLLLMDETDPEKITFLNGIVNSARRAGELTQKLLAFGRRGKNLIEAVNINHIVKEVYGILERSIDKSIELKSELSEDIYFIDGDPSQINQVIMNLCVNAKEAMPYGGKILVRTENKTLTKDFCTLYPELKEGEYVELTVTDKGCGMTEDVRKRIFEPFFTTKKDGSIKGTGLGLATVYGIVKNHNGIVELHTEPGRGTTFIVYLPRGSKNKEIEERHENRIDEDYGTILVIDDEDLFRDMLKAMLQRYGYSVLTACDGKEGIHIYKQRHREIRGVIIDMKMPVMGGKDAFIEMKKINPHIRALLCTGYGHNEEAQEILDLGVKDLLPKPCGSGELSEKLKKLFM